MSCASMKIAAAKFDLHQEAAPVGSTSPAPVGARTSLDRVGTLAGEVSEDRLQLLAERPVMRVRPRREIEPCAPAPGNRHTPSTGRASVHGPDLRNGFALRRVDLRHVGAGRRPMTRPTLDGAIAKNRRSIPKRTARCVLTDVLTNFVSPASERRP